MVNLQQTKEMKQSGKWLMLIALLIFQGGLMAQEDDDFRTEEERKADEAADAYWDNLEKDDVERKGFYAGIYVGALMSNGYSARMYDGYGFDLDGNRNNFENSFLNLQINGPTNNPNLTMQMRNRVTQALNETMSVDPHDWEFTIEDMPRSDQIKYNIAFAFGLQGRYNFDDRNSLLFNINFSQVTVNAEFTITILNPQPISDPGNPGAIVYPDRYPKFGIRGDEQRVMLQLGYQRILGNNDFFNWVIEAGADLTFAKFGENQAQINSYVINLKTFYNQVGGFDRAARNLTGVAAGVFGGFGGQIEAGGKWTIQLLYNPIYQKIALGTDTRYGLHHTLGLRAIYNI